MIAADSDLIKALDYEIAQPHAREDHQARLVWARNRLYQLAVRQGQVLAAFNALVPRMQDHYIEFATRAHDHKVEADPVYAAYRLQCEQVTDLYRELEKEQQP